MEKYRKNKPKKSLVNVNPQADDAGIKNLSKATIKAHPLGEKYEYLVEKVKKNLKNKIIINTRTPNRALGQYALRTDAIGRAARSERTRRNRGKGEKIRPAMRILKGHLKGKRVRAGELLKISGAVSKAAPRTIKSAVKRAGFELKIEKSLSRLKKQAMEQGIKQGMSMARSRLKKTGAVPAPAPTNTPAKQSVNIGANLFRAKGVPKAGDIKKSVIHQALAKTIEQSQLPKDFDPYTHYIGRNGGYYKWDEVEHARGKERPMPGQVRALAPITGFATKTTDVKPGNPSIMDWFRKGHGPVVDDSNATVQKPFQPKTIIPKVPTEKVERLKRLKEINKSSMLKTLNKQRTKEWEHIKRMRSVGAYNQNTFLNARSEWQQKWREQGFEPTDPFHVNIKE